MEDSTRSERVATSLTPRLREKLEREAERRRWSLSQTVAVAAEEWVESRQSGEQGRYAESQAQ